MPVYEYVCDQDHLTTAHRAVNRRNDPVPCNECEGETRRAFVSAPHMGAIPGIYNRVNRNWSETGQVLYDPERPEYLPKYRNPKD